jgi:PKD repeat protein
MVCYKVFTPLGKVITPLFIFLFLWTSAYAEPQIVNPDFQNDGGFFQTATGWSPFGGTKWESVWDPDYSFTQGIADIEPGQLGGIYQQIAVTPGQSYRLSVYGKTTRSGYTVALGVDPTGAHQPDSVDFQFFGAASDWTPLAIEFVATASRVTVFLAGKNESSHYLWSNWVQFDGVGIETIGIVNTPPNAIAFANPTSGSAPLEVQFEGDGSFDADEDPLSFDWDFGDGSSPGIQSNPVHIFEDDGSYEVRLTVNDGQGGADTADLVITVGSMTDRLVNGDFSDGLLGWSLWQERGALNPNVGADGELQVSGSGHNGGLYQQFITGGAGSELAVSGFWASAPTVANAQWAEVLVINGSRLPADGQDIHAGQGDVVMIYKNHTWASPGGWSGEMSETAPVHASAKFIAADEVATIILKSGNLQGIFSGTRFDRMAVTSPTAPPPPPNRPPVAELQADPTSGPVPLTVSFDAGGSWDQDDDPLTFAWDFDDGRQGSGPQIDHTYDTAGTFTVTVTVSDGQDGQDQLTMTIRATEPEEPPAPIDWDERLTQLGIFRVDAVVSSGDSYWKLIRAQFESDGDILPPPGGGNESHGRHAIYYRVLDINADPIQGQKVVASWPTGNPTSVVEHETKGPGYDDYWANFAMYGGWCPYWPEGGHGSYGAYVSGAPSDQVWGMGLPCNRHVSYRLTWQYTVKP